MSACTCVCVYMRVDMRLYLCVSELRVYVMCAKICACVYVCGRARERVYLCVDITSMRSKNDKSSMLFSYMDVYWTVFKLSSTLKQSCLKMMPKYNMRVFYNSYCERIIFNFTFARNSLNSEDILDISWQNRRYRKKTMTSFIEQFVRGLFGKAEHGHIRGSANYIRTIISLV